MASSSRNIFSETDPVAQLDEIFAGSDRGQRGLPLGNLTRHLESRIDASYCVLCLVEALARRGRLTPGMTIVATGAAQQDKQASMLSEAMQGEIQAAHVIPCDLLFGPQNRRLYDLFANPFNATWVRRNVFGRTTAVHRLTNYVDRRCEADGMIDALVGACSAVLNGQARAERRIADVLADYATAAETGRQKLRQALSAAERAEAAKPVIAGADGRPYGERPADVRITSPDLGARVANKFVALQIFDAYVNIARHMEPARLRAVAGQVEALMLNERSY